MTQSERQEMFKGGGGILLREPAAIIKSQSGGTSKAITKKEPDLDFRNQINSSIRALIINSERFRKIRSLVDIDVMDKKNILRNTEEFKFLGLIPTIEVDECFFNDLVAPCQQTKTISYYPADKVLKIIKEEYKGIEIELLSKQTLIDTQKPKKEQTNNEGVVSNILKGFKEWWEK
ncbi:hypothetical protein HYX02_02150 [Candidatus Woesearchaeota archaeon]|nr:hypothetical protein [Candidatus Woesearchaeota archaeon]